MIWYGCVGVGEDIIFPKRLGSEVMFTGDW